MKKILFGLLIGALAACSNQKDVILQTASHAVIQFSKDTVRVREKDWTNVRGTGNGNVTLYLTDPGHQLNMRTDSMPSPVHLLYRGTEIKSGESMLVMDSVQLYCVADLPGLYEIDLYLTDRLGRGETKKLFVRCVPNTTASPSFFWRDLGSEQMQSWNYVFDASNTNKPDGTISEYHYSINGQEISTNQPVMYWTFHAKGDHKIGLYVVDDLGNKSVTLYQTLTIL
ncbi:hypothetical protein [Sediminibacterium sp.]|uniref:hypothetical protein n=1 Tax=Sediminibacterium sp. TaxID=1917865 RepID=UPI00273168D5|nr:hypothetical protein [Sediminibacterium sp.]MDP2421449.1 hypothetical protein [Sediminibacterium sp.]